MESIRYSSPPEALENSELPQHRFEIIVDEVVIGAAEIDYLSKPLPMYQITDLFVDYEHKGRGYASQLMNKVEEWLIAKGKPGILVEAIIEGDPAESMYEKRRWTPVTDGLGLRVFNWPEGVDLSILKGYESRYTDPTLRGV